MPSPADAQNLAHNLGVIAGVRNLAAGTKLAFDEDTGRFTAQVPGKLQSLMRTFSSDTVTSDRYFGEPIREVFAAARAKIGGGVTQLEFNRAVAGLVAMRGGYADAKLTALNKVIADAELGVRSDSAASIALRTKFATYLLYGFSQRMFLPETNHGVCYSFALDWGRRILGGKPTFAHSKKAALPVAPTFTLSTAQKQRIMKKVIGRIAPMQAELKNYQASSFGNVATVMFAKYGNLMVGPVTRHAMPIADTDKGSDVLGAVLRLAFAERGAEMSILSIKQKVGGGGHAVGLFYDDAALRFFDSNVGEFRFAWDAGDDTPKFFNEWWSTFYMTGATQAFGSWTLESVTLRPPRA